MKLKNEGTFERIIRLILGFSLIIWGYLESGEYWSSYETPTYPIPCWIWENFIALGCLVERGFTVSVIGVVPFLTGLIGWCPLNSLFNINTCKK